MYGPHQYWPSHLDRPILPYNQSFYVGSNIGIPACHEEIISGGLEKLRAIPYSQYRCCTLVLFVVFVLVAIVSDSHLESFVRSLQTLVI